MPALARSAFRNEIVVRTINNLRGPADVEALVALAAQHGVGTINLAAKQDEDDEIASGLVFYASALAPRAPGYEAFDALAETIRAAHARGIKVRAWMPQFHDQMAIRSHPAWQMQAFDGHRAVAYAGRDRREYFVNPVDPAARDYQRLLIEEIVRRYEVDGIVLDWLRFDDFNMDLGGETRTKFKAAAGFDPLGIDFSSDNLQRRQWNAWRVAVIADHVRRARRHRRRARRRRARRLYPAAGIPRGRAGRGAVLALGRFPVAHGLLPRLGISRHAGSTATSSPRSPCAPATPRVIPVLDEDWSDAAARTVLPEIGRMHPAIATLSWFAYGKWTPATMQRLERLSRL